MGTNYAPLVAVLLWERFRAVSFYNYQDDVI